ncbi:unnamed protein product [Lampetra fluviatilis]
MSKAGARRKNPLAHLLEGAEVGEEAPAVTPEPGTPVTVPMEMSGPEREESAAGSASSPPPPETESIPAALLQQLLQAVGQLTVRLAEVEARTQPTGPHSGREQPSTANVETTAIFPATAPPEMAAMLAATQSAVAMLARELYAAAATAATRRPADIVAATPQDGAMAAMATATPRLSPPTRPGFLGTPLLRDQLPATTRLYIKLRLPGGPRVSTRVPSSPGRRGGQWRLPLPRTSPCRRNGPRVLPRLHLSPRSRGRPPAMPRFCTLPCLRPLSWMTPRLRVIPPRLRRGPWRLQRRGASPRRERLPRLRPLSRTSLRRQGGPRGPPRLRVILRVFGVARGGRNAMVPRRVARGCRGYGRCPAPRCAGGVGRGGRCRPELYRRVFGVAR